MISGVGHETDFTIADFAADLRAPTPTAAAELATPNQIDIRATLAEQNIRLGRSFAMFLFARHGRLEGMQNQLRLRSPLARIRRDRQRLDDLSRYIGLSLAHILQIHRTLLGGLEQRLDALNPHSILKRGFALVSDMDGRLIKSVAQVHPGESLQVRVSDGEFGVRVREEDRNSVE